jgi:hypothetical protein
LKNKGRRHSLDFLEKEEKNLEKKFRNFLKIWREHIRDEIGVHKKMLSGRQPFPKHVKNTWSIHEKMFKRLKKI